MHPSFASSLFFYLLALQSNGTVLTLFYSCSSANGVKYVVLIISHNVPAKRGAGVWTFGALSVGVIHQVLSAIWFQVL